MQVNRFCYVVCLFLISGFRSSRTLNACGFVFGSQGFRFRILFLKVLFWAFYFHVFKWVCYSFLWCLFCLHFSAFGVVFHVVLTFLLIKFVLLVCVFFNFKIWLICQFLGLFFCTNFPPFFFFFWCVFSFSLALFWVQGFDLNFTL